MWKHPLEGSSIGIFQIWEYAFYYENGKVYFEGVERMMKFEFKLKNGKTHWITFPKAVEIRRAIVWVPKETNDGDKSVPNLILLPDEVERVEVIDDD